MYPFTLIQHLRLFPLLFWIFLLLVLSNDIEVNPGPRPPKYPCGVCSKAVKWSDHGVLCDSCETWFHTTCIGMCDEIYFSLSPNISWNCFHCGLPNFSTRLFNDTPADSLLPPSLENLTHASTASNPNPDNFDISATSDHRTLGHPAHSSSPKPLVHPPRHSTTSSISSNSTVPDHIVENLPKPIQGNKQLRILNINFQSIRPKKIELWNLLESTNADIILGTETFLRPDIYNSEIFPPHFNVYRRDRPHQAYGGVLVAAKTSLISHQIPTNSNSEAVLISIQTQNKNCNLIVGALYRPPNQTSDEYTNSLTDVMKLACRSPRDVVWLGGDFNLPDINWESMSIERCQYTKSMNSSYLETINNLGLVQTNHTPTRNGAILDIFLTNRPSLTTRTTTLPALSDHDVVMSDFTIQPAKTKNVPRTVYIWKKANVEAMKEEIRTFSENLLEESENNESAEIIRSKIHTKLSNVLNDHVPMKSCSTKFHQPWVNTDMKRLSRRKDRAWKKAKATDKTADWNRFNTLQKESRRAGRKAYAIYIKGMVSEEDGARKKLWRFMKSKKSDSMGVAPLKKAGLVYSNPSEKANILNEQFCSVFTEEDMNSMPDLGESPHPDMPDIQVTVQGVHKLLKNLNPSKAAGPDNIPCRLLVLVAQEIAPALTLLFNRSLQTGETPAAWRHATVQPVFKKSDRSQACNYRPISLTSVCCKMLEHIVRSAVTSHFDQNNILVDAQHGFRKMRSCETQLILTVEDLAKNMDQGGQSDAILLDFSKAFDVVPHRRLLLKLHHLGIRGQALKWIESFLSNRTQQVAVEGQLSDVGKVTSGVPQGSVLGPTLFLAYINDLNEGIQSIVKLFADDTMLYRAIKSALDTRILQEDLSRLETWETKWQMSFNASKCLVLSITKKKKPISHDYQLHGETLQNVDSAKYLGVELTKNLSWGKHVQSITNKANKTSAFVYRNLRGSPRSVQSACYKTLVRPTLEYASPVWDPHQQNLTTDIEKVQRRAARRICGDFRPTTSASALVAKLELPTLKERRTIAKATMMYKVMTGLVDVVPKSGTLTPALRQRRGQEHALQIPSSRTDTHLYSFFPSAIRLWNSIPHEATRASTPETFKTLVEGWLKGQK